MYTTGVPEPFRLEFAKFVRGFTEKEKLIQALLEKHFERPNPNREFFRCSSHDVYEFFQLIDGSYLVNADKPDPHDLRKFAFS